MANYTVTPKFPRSSDVVNVALLMAQRQSDSTTTNGGIVANGNPAVPLLGQGGVNDSLGQATAYFQAQVDALLCSVGFQAQDNQLGNGPNAFTSTTFANVFPSYTFAASVAKTYVVTVEVTCGAAVLSSGRCSVSFQVVNNSTTYAPGTTWVIDMISTTPYYHGSWCIPIPMVAGNNVLQLQAVQNVAGATANFTGAGSRVFTIMG